jgi:hypothetical protein
MIAMNMANAQRTLSRSELVQLIGLAPSHAEQLNRYRGNIPANADVIAGCLYSMVEVTVLRDHFTFFQEKRSTLTESNLCTPGHLEAPEQFAIKSIGLVFAPTTDRVDRELFAENYLLEFWVGQREYFRNPIAEIFSIGDGNLTDPMQPLRASADLTDFPLMLNYDRDFYGIANGQPFTLRKPLKVWMVLRGLYMRGIC